jgi:DNA-binding beta-propeller fold protein YncE
MEVQFNSPLDVAVSADGTLYIADYGNHRVRMIRNRQVTTIAGSGTAGFADGAAAQAQFYYPMGVAVSADGTLYIADNGYHCVRMIRNGKVTTIAGSGTPGFADGAAAQAQFHCPVGVAVNADGTLYISDSRNHRIRMVRAGQITTIAGNGTAGFADGASLIQTSSVASIANQNLNLAKCIDLEFETSVQIGDTTLQLPRSFVSVRCPALLKSSLRVQPVDAQSIQLFHQFLYTNSLPDDDLRLKQIVGLSVRAKTHFHWSPCFKVS